MSLDKELIQNGAIRVMKKKTVLLIGGSSDIGIATATIFAE